MPHWLRNQLMRAFQRGDSRKVRLLNDCWYFYRSQAFQSRESMKESMNSEHTFH